MFGEVLSFRIRDGLEGAVMVCDSLIEHRLFGSSLFVLAGSQPELMRQKKELVALTWGIRRIHFPRKARKAIAEGVDLEMAPTDT
jgi:hypothetical protein